MRIILKKKNSPSLWLVSWAKQKARKIDKLRAERNLPFLVRTYPFQDTRRVVVRSYRNATYIDVRGIGGVPTVTTPVRNRTSPLSSQTVSAITGKLVVRSLSFDVTGKPINAVNAAAIGFGLKIDKIIVDPNAVLTTNEVATWDAVAVQGLPAPLTQIFFDTSRQRSALDVVFEMPSVLQSLTGDSHYLGSIELIYYERITRLLTFKLASSSIADNFSDPDNVIFKLATNKTAAQLIMLTVPVDSLLNTRNASTYEGTLFFDQTLTDVPAGTALFASWSTFPSISAGTVPTTDGAFDIITETASVFTTLQGRPVSFNVRIFGTVADGVASQVRIVDGDLPVRINGVTVNSDLSKIPILISDLRSTIASNFGLAVNEVGASMNASGISDGRWHGAGGGSLEGVQDGFAITSQGGSLLGGPNLATGAYKYGGDLSARGCLTATPPPDFIGRTCLVLSSPYETLTAVKSALGRSLSFSIGVYQGLLVGFTTGRVESGSYTSSTTVANDPHASYGETMSTYEAIEIRWATGGAVPSSGLGNPAGGGSFVQAPGTATFQLAGTSMSFSATPYRDGITVSLGSGSSIFISSAFADDPRGMHTLFSAEKLEAGILTAENIIHDPQSGMTASENGLFNASGVKLRAANIFSVGTRVAGPSPSTSNSIRRLFGGGPNIPNTPIDLPATNTLVVNRSDWTGVVTAGKGTGGATLAGSSVTSDQMKEASISASDSGLPAVVDLNIVWFSAAGKGLFMADRLGGFSAAWTLWIQAVENKDDASVIDALAAAAMAQLTVYYNNFASNEFVLSVTKNGLGDLLIVIEE